MVTDWSKALARLVTEHPLAWVVSGGAETFNATPLPLRPVLGADGHIETLLGHFARSNGHVEALRGSGRALVLFMGPHGYISPSWLSDRTQAPTWNYAAAQFVVDVDFVAPGDERALLRDLIGAMEADRPDAWNLDELGPRYARLAPGIVGFRARVIETRPMFKLGQTEPPHFFAQMLSALEREGRHDLSDWMGDFGRPGG